MTDRPNEDKLLTQIEVGVVRLPRRDIPTLRIFRRTISQQIAKWPPREAVALADRMVRSGDDTVRYLAYELLQAHKPARKSLDADDLNRLGCTLDSWDSVDTFSLYLSGPAWRDGQISEETIHQWAQSENLWWRRTALVSTVIPSRRGTPEDSRRAIKVCELLIDDREDMVVKALSWALRELVKHDAVAVAAFLEQYEDRVAPRARRETRNKLTTGLKNPKNKNSAPT